MLTSVKIYRWKQLQQKVKNILSECGFTVDEECVPQNARGSAEIDVYAKVKINNREYSIVVECKHWKNKIPQTVIHGFRTIVSDIGANLGIIITTSNYQSGAYEAVKYTNIKVLTWDEFQCEFKKQWIETLFHQTITKELDPLFSYTEPLTPKWFRALTPEDKDLFEGLYEKYVRFGVFMFSLSRWWHGDREIPALPLSNEVIQKYNLDNLPEEILKSIGCREFLGVCLDYGNKAIPEFRLLKERSSKD